MLISGIANAKETKLEDNSYRRSSLYSILVSHTDKKFNTEIENCFMYIPIPDTYNDHDLSVKIVNLEGSIEKEKVNKKRKQKDLLKLMIFSRIIRWQVD